jgi:hypothetical protein
MIEIPLVSCINKEKVDFSRRLDAIYNDGMVM